MSNLPNSTDEKIKVYPNEYITNITMNRPNLRLLDNDKYLENLVSGYDETVLDGLSGEVINNAAAITTNAGDIVTNAAGIASNVSDITTLSSDLIDHQTMTSIRIGLSADQVLAGNTNSLVAFTSAWWDDNSEWNSSNTSFEWKPAVATTATFGVSCFVRVTTVGLTTSEWNLLQLFKNGVLYAMLDTIEGTAGTIPYHSLQGTSTVKMVSGDKIDIRLYNDDTTDGSLEPSVLGREAFYLCIDRIK